VITVVSALAWQFAFDLNTRFVNTGFAWLPGIGPGSDAEERLVAATRRP
jgi:multiple sugar transport system permease protein